MAELKTPVQVVVESVFTGQCWRGEVEIVPGTETMELEQLFRFFNRVEEEDVERLDSIGFNQPSMSVGDLIEVGDARYRCAATGWQREST